MQSLGILIGRFQPFHLGHRFLIETALGQSDEVLVLIGSSYRGRNIKNPWTFEERRQMILDAFKGQALHFAAIPDFFYDEQAWVHAVEEAVNKKFPDAQKTLFGHTKDDSSYYLKLFGNWEFHELPDYQGINATLIRERFFLQKHILDSALPPETSQALEIFLHSNLYPALHEEAQYIHDYQKTWQYSPYPPIFTTTDAVVICEECILLIQRGHAPGKGLFALPGGYLEAGEWIIDGLIRELHEETSIAVDKPHLKAALQEIKAYDYPDRSNIGRVITHAGLFILQHQSCPLVKAHDDALSADWYPINQLFALQDQFHEDHYQIIRDLLRRHGLFK